MTSDQVAAMIAARDASTAPTSEQPAPAQADPMENFVLYTRKECRGSSVVSKMIEPVREDFRVVDIKTLDPSALPNWLDGTPILVDVRTTKRELYRGTDAAAKIHEVYPTISTGGATVRPPAADLDNLP